MTFYFSITSPCHLFDISPIFFATPQHLPLVFPKYHQPTAHKIFVISAQQLYIHSIYPQKCDFCYGQAFTCYPAKQSSDCPPKQHHPKWLHKWNMQSWFNSFVLAAIWSVTTGQRNQKFAAMLLPILFRYMKSHHHQWICTLYHPAMPVADLWRFHL